MVFEIRSETKAICNCLKTFNKTASVANVEDEAKNHLVDEGIGVDGTHLNFHQIRMSFLVFYTGTGKPLP